MLVDFIDWIFVTEKPSSTMLEQTKLLVPFTIHFSKNTASFGSAFLLWYPLHSW